MTDLVERLKTTASARSWAEADEQRDEAADEIERLRAEVAALKEEHHFQACLTRDLLPYQERAVKAEAEIDRLRAEVAALKKDADRYRWLRSSFRVARWDVKYWTGEFWDVMYGDAMDKQIDAALKEQS